MWAGVRVENLVGMTAVLWVAVWEVRWVERRVDLSGV